MIRSIQNWLIIGGILALAGLGYWFYDRWEQASQEKISKTATILLERIQRVAKLATIEGHFNELYEQKSFTYFDISPFRKKLLVRVNAKVVVGYDFERLSIEVDSLRRTIWINELPAPAILYIDHTLDYYDITEGIFTSFQESDYNKIHAEAKELIRKKAAESNLIPEAQKQGQELKEMLTLIVEASGWQIQIRNRPKLNQ
jgi:hypothetical protein